MKYSFPCLKIHLISFAILISLFSAQTTIVLAANKLGDAENISKKTTIFILEPKIYTGSPAYNSQPLPDQSFVKPVYMRAISEAAESAFNERGYKVINFNDLGENTTSPDFQQAYESAWQIIIQNTRSGKLWTDKTKFFNIDPYQKILRTIDNTIDLLVFTQIYLQYSPEELSQSAELAAKASATAGSVAVQAFAMNSPVIYLFASKDPVRCKVSIFDSKTGDLVWYRSGTAYLQDLRSKRSAEDELKSFYMQSIPQASNSDQKDIEEPKFKRKRSELMRKVENEANPIDS